MRDLWRDAFDPQRQQAYKQHLNKIRQSWKDNRDCFACKSCKDVSDKWNTCHLCQYTNNPIPHERTCLLWEPKEVSAS